MTFVACRSLRSDDGSCQNLSLFWKLVNKILKIFKYLPIPDDQIWFLSEQHDRSTPATLNYHASYALLLNSLRYSLIMGQRNVWVGLGLMASLLWTSFQNTFPDGPYKKNNPGIRTLDFAGFFWSCYLESSHKSSIWSTFTFQCS